MVAPLVALGAASAGAGLAGSIFGKKSLPTFDPTAIINAANQGATAEKGYASQIVPGVNQNLSAFQQGVTGAENKATAAQTQADQEYLANLDPITSKILQNQTGQLKQNIFGAIPEAQNAAREALAASGGLSRGVSAESLAKIPIQAAQQFGEGATTLNTQALQAKQQAVGQLYSEESAQIAEQLGIDRDTYNTILNSGDQALITQVGQLIDSQRNQTGLTTGALAAQQNGQFAAATGAAANQNAIFNSLTQLGGTALGYGLSQPGSTAAPQAPGVQNVNPTVRRNMVLSALAGQGA